MLCLNRACGRVSEGERVTRIYCRRKVEGWRYRISRRAIGILSRADGRDKIVGKSQLLVGKQRLLGEARAKLRLPDRRHAAIMTSYLLGGGLHQI